MEQFDISRTNKEEFDSICKKYSDEYFEEIEKNKKILIEAFVIYYGEKYRNIITERFNSISFATFLSTNLIKDLKINEQSDNEFIYNLIYLHKFYCDNPTYVGFTYDKNALYKFDDEFAENLKKKLSTSNLNGFEHHSYDTSNNRTLYSVFLALFVSDRTLIHEINHAITSTVISMLENDFEKFLIYKTGISVALKDNVNNEEFEEVLNELSAKEITEIFHNLGGCVQKRKVSYTNSIYVELFPYVLKFYNKYKDLIKEARITENKNILFTKIEKGKYNIYANLIKIKYIIIKKTDLSSLKLDYDLDEINSLIDSMDKEYVEEDINGYIEELRKQGNSVTLLNDFEGKSK